MSEFALKALQVSQVDLVFKATGVCNEHFVHRPLRVDENDDDKVTR